MKDEADKLRNALNLYREGDLPRAQMLLELLDLERLEPALHVEANYLWGLVLARRGDPLEAAHRFQTCIRLDQRFFPALDAWGNVLANLGDARGAIEKYKRALGVAGPEQSSHILYNYGQVLMKHGYVLRALRKFRESYKRRAGSDAAYMAGACFLQMNRALGARRWMQRALAIEPANARNVVGLGCAHALDNRSSQAIACFQEALALDPQCAEAHYNWARVLATQGEYAKAARRCKQGLRINPDGFELLAHQAFCLRQMGAYDAALHTARRMRQALQRAGRSEHKADFIDIVTANEAACLRALGRTLQARNKLIEQVRQAKDPSPESLAELRFHDIKRLRGAHRYELTLSARVPGPEFGSDDEEPTPHQYQRTYWVVARSLKEARRIVRELEPPEAEIRFDADVVVGELLEEADQGVTERSPAIPVE
ncbi:MAG: tetratricopeptide repeat protein [Planctomycetes bacterium]|nr:tetratricopeptide repeat protein [Planctomycetota bacterium]